MVNWIKKLLAAFIIIALSVFVVVRNQTDVTVRLWPGADITSSSGVLLLGAFLVGIGCAAVVALFFGLKSYLRERRLYKNERQRQEFYQGMVQARSFVATGEWRRAREAWERLIRRDPTNLIARIELSRCLEQAGDVREALKVIDAARTEDNTNVEVLFRAVELNLSLQNKTAAVDNLALILCHHPNRRAAALARDLSEDLGRIEDALEYHDQLENMSERSVGNEEVRLRLRYKQINRDAAADPAVLREEVRQFSRKNPGFVPALLDLAAMESAAGKTEEAAKAMLQAAKRSGDTNFWRAIGKLWVRAANPDRAVSAMKTAAKETTGLARLIVEIEAVKLDLELGRLEEAKNRLDGFDELAKSEGVVLPPDLASTALALKTACLLRLGETAKAAESCLKLAGDETAGDDLRRSFSSAEDSAPSPTLSTP
jgi:tetratricopeptide (TPR) repeat protein